MNTLRLFAAFSLLFSFGLSAYAATPDARSIVDTYLERATPESELAYVKMVNVPITNPPTPPVEYRFLAMTKELPSGKYAYLIRMVRPLEVEGVTLLTNEDVDGEVKQYLYLPASGRVTEIRGDGKSGRFMGSEFSFEDLMRELPANFDYVSEPDESFEGREVFVIKATPKQDVYSHYAYRRLYIDQETYDLLGMRFYDESGAVTKEIDAQCYDSKDVLGETRRPEVLTSLNPSDGSSSYFQVLEGRVNPDLLDDYFTSETISTWTPDDVNEVIFDYGIESWGDWDEAEE
ncbi:MAG: outer membrane lipoprotein-sorting protein [Verrucomicrobiota bacterium]